ncbi:MAG: hypothetical protein QOG10_7031 [Kribbellaceae bacterium]|jgi:hypothetical protein|nr:hypothetical protein [Kribbellaceae bacterium]
MRVLEGSPIAVNGAKGGLLVDPLRFWPDVPIRQTWQLGNGTRRGVRALRSDLACARPRRAEPHQRLTVIDDLQHLPVPATAEVKGC